MSDVHSVVLTTIERALTNNIGAMKGEENMAQINNVVVGTKYVDRKDKEGKRICTVIEVNTKTKTVMVEFEDGKSRPYVVTNFLKSFKKLEADAEPEQTEEKIEPVKVEKSEVKKADSEPTVTIDDNPLEDVAGDGTPLAEVGKEIAEQAKQKAKETVEKKEKKEKKAKKPKKEDKQVIDSAIKTMDELKVTHKESWQNKGTAMYVGKVRVFECWKRMERMRINYNPELTSLDEKFCISKEEDKREKSHLSVTCYIAADKVADAVKELVKHSNTKEIEALNAKKAEKKSKKTAKQTESEPAEKTE